jgi:hypothetical protein
MKVSELQKEPQGNRLVMAGRQLRRWVRPGRLLLLVVAPPADFVILRIANWNKVLDNRGDLVADVCGPVVTLKRLSSH